MQAPEFVVDGRRFAVAKVSTFSYAPHLFAVVNYGGEITVVAPEHVVEEMDTVEVEKGFRLLSYANSLPFDTVGFIARITAALADRRIPVLVISSYSTDHILVREGDLDAAVEVLEGLGFEVRKVLIGSQQS